MNDPKTTIAGYLLAVGTALTAGAATTHAPAWVGILAGALATVGAILLGRSAKDASPPGSAS